MSQDTENIVHGIILGFIAASLAIIAISIMHRNELRSVGIERIERCHNVHSNWNEIVWTSTVRGR